MNIKELLIDESRVMHDSSMARSSNSNDLQVLKCKTLYSSNLLAVSPYKSRPRTESKKSVLFFEFAANQRTNDISLGVRDESFSRHFATSHTQLFVLPKTHLTTTASSNTINHVSSKRRHDDLRRSCSLFVVQCRATRPLLGQGFARWQNL